MKKVTFLFLCIFFLFQNCSSQGNLDKASVDLLVAKQEFTFMAERATPTNYDVINVMNSMPNSTASRILNLSYGYTLTIKDKILVVNLPYFGRTFTPNLTTNNNGLNFTSKEFAIELKKGKKGKYIISIMPKDVSSINSMNLEVFPNGKSYLSVNPNDRQPISYDGYIMKNEDLKK